MRTKFNRYASSQYLQCLSVLQDLLKSEGLDSVHRAYCDIVNLEVKNRWIQSQKVSESDDDISESVGSPSLHQLLGKNKSIPELEKGSHVSLWEKSGQPYLYLVQRYQGISWKEILSIVNQCQNLNLMMDIEVINSWWFPGNTFNMEIRKQY